jgi:hypothetical protein
MPRPRCAQFLALTCLAATGWTGIAFAADPSEGVATAPADLDEDQRRSSSGLNAAVVFVVKITGVATLDLGGERRPLTKGERVSVGSMLATGDAAKVLLVLSNGTLLELGPQSTLAVDHFHHEPFAETVRVNTMSREPSNSQVRLRLIRGEVIASLLPLNVAQGSTFRIETGAGWAEPIATRNTLFRIVFQPDAQPPFRVEALIGEVRVRDGRDGGRERTLASDRPMMDPLRGTIGLPLVR